MIQHHTLLSQWDTITPNPGPSPILKGKNWGRVPFVAESVPGATPSPKIQF